MVSSSRSQLIDTIVEGFHAPGSKESKAIAILEKVFGFNLSEFIDHYVSKKDKKKFLSELLYSLYYEDIVLSELESRTESLEYYMLQILSELVSENTLKNILNELSPQKQIALICYSYKYYREGSYYILRLFEGKEYDALLKGLRRKYFDVNTLSQLINHEFPLELILQKLEEQAQAKTREAHSIYNSLVPLMVESPVRVHNAIEGLKQQYSPPPLEVIQKRDSLKNQFDSSFSYEEFLTFVQLFGLEKHQPQFEFEGSINETNTLVDNLRILHQIFSDPLLVATLSAKDVYSYFSYVFNIQFHLNAMLRTPSEYLEGLDRITCGIPTKGKNLAQLSTLPTLLLGLSTITKFLKKKLKDYPIFVYDQSNIELFQKNRKYVNKLNRQYKSSIVHVSQDEALTLTKKLGIEELLDTTGERSFGYGGMRNCVSLLTLVLKNAPDEKELSTIFYNEVLKGKNGILMLDDDMVVPEANIFSYALFMKKTPNDYSYSYGYMEGRGTRLSNDYPPLDDFLSLRINPFEHTRILPFIAPASMSEYIMRPKICINLPFANEEMHFEGIFDIIPFLQTSWHLAGTRYSDKQFPTHFFVGLEEHLRKFIPYTIQISMIRHLLDPLNEYGTSALPWNQKEVRYKLTSLQEVFNFISQEETAQRMQRMFWMHMKEFFYPGAQPMKLRQDIDNLIHMDVEGIIKNFSHKQKLTVAERKSLKNIAEVYHFYQQDAKYMWEFGSNVLENIQDLDKAKDSIEEKYSMRIKDYPITQAFYLLFKSVGAAGFNKIIRRINAMQSA